MHAWAITIYDEMTQQTQQGHHHLLNAGMQAKMNRTKLGNVVAWARRTATASCQGMRALSWHRD